jgi:hypothetical protein
MAYTTECKTYEWKQDALWHNNSKYNDIHVLRTENGPSFPLQKHFLIQSTFITVERKQNGFHYALFALTFPLKKLLNPSDICLLFNKLLKVEIYARNVCN